MITTLAVHGFRSLADLVMPLGQITVITGPNGVGKSNIYRALQLLARTAEGDMVSAMAHDGGLGSLRWAGPERISGAMKRGEVPVQGGPRTAPVALELGFASDTLGYLIDIGLPQPTGDAFAFDPVIKREVIFDGPVMRPASTLAQRKWNGLQVRDGSDWLQVAADLTEWDSILSEVADPQAYPEIQAVRNHVRSWRFYDTFRTDADAPARRPQVGVRTPVLANDGSDLASAILTILGSAYGPLLTEAVETALDARLTVNTDGLFELMVTQPGLLRPLRARELSDGSLRFLLLAAALLSPRPPRLLVINEPETSLHPGLVETVAGLIKAASERTQIVVVSHSTAIIDALTDSDEVVHHELRKPLGATEIANQGLLTKPEWNWGRR